MDYTEINVPANGGTYHGRVPTPVARPIELYMIELVAVRQRVRNPIGPGYVARVVDRLVGLHLAGRWEEAATEIRTKTAEWNQKRAYVEAVSKRSQVPSRPKPPIDPDDDF